jgi:hypothetical protein
MTMPAYNSFQLYRGDTLQFMLTLNTSGSAYSIPAGSIFTGAVKEKGATTTTADFDTSVTSASAGKVLFTLSSVESSLLDAKKNWVYDVQFETVTGVVTTLMAGNIFVTDQVTT